MHHKLKPNGFFPYFETASFVTIDPGKDPRVGRRGGAPRHSMGPVLGQAVLGCRRLQRPGSSRKEIRRFHLEKKTSSEKASTTDPNQERRGETLPITTSQK